MKNWILNLVDTRLLPWAYNRLLKGYIEVDSLKGEGVDTTKIESSLEKLRVSVERLEAKMQEIKCRQKDS